MPDANGRIVGIIVPRIPWLEELEGETYEACPTCGTEGCDDCDRLGVVVHECPEG